MKAADISPRAPYGSLLKSNLPKKPRKLARTLGRNPRELRKHAIQTIETFNEYTDHLEPHEWMAIPLLRAAIVSRMHWMHVLCPGCQTIKAIDLRVVPRSFDIALTAIADKLRCETCHRQAAAPRIVKLTTQHGG